MDEITNPEPKQTKDETTEKMGYELVEAPSPEEMAEYEKHTHTKIEPESLIIGKPIDIVKYILKRDLKEYKIVKK